MPDRSLTSDEINALIANGCTAEAWELLRVCDSFDPASVQRVRFQGKNTLGAFRASCRLPSGAEHPSGVYDALLHECVIEDNALLAYCPEGAHRYHIHEGAVVFGVASLSAEPNTRFGQAEEVLVINEAGGRPVPLLPMLDAQTAYLFAMYPHRVELQVALRRLVETTLDQLVPTQGVIGAGASVTHSGRMRNIVVEPHARVDGAALLVDGWIASSEANPSYIGAGVQAETFTVAPGGRVDSRALLRHCFVGQAAHIGEGFTAENSLFFANCEMMQGEACSYFAGPFAVSHHKSTLLLTAIVSFYNAGSGTNASNHRYKTGPVHQGVLERGCKTGSSSYLLWPGHIGPYSTVIGKHYSTLDTGDMPFSLLLEEKGQSILIPGATLFSVGTFRDAQKWTARDKRGETERLDLVAPSPWSPYTMQRVVEGHRILQEISGSKGARKSEYNWGGATIPASGITKGCVVYELAIRLYRGQVLSRVILSHASGGREGLLARIQPSSEIGTARWIDVAGLYAPEEAFDETVADLIAGALDSLPTLQARWQTLHDGFSDYEWAWVWSQWREALGREIDLSDIGQALTAYQEALAFMRAQLLTDLEKEFQPAMHTGYAIRSSEVEDAFNTVRGRSQDSPVRQQIEKAISSEATQADEALKALQG